MKYILILLLACMAYTAEAQKIVRDEVDQFNGIRFKETNWTAINRDMLTALSFKLRKADTSYVLYMRYYSPDIVSVAEGDLMYLLFHNGTVVKLPAVQYAISANGSTKTIDITYALPKEYLSTFDNYEVKSVRLSFTGGTYKDIDLDEKKSGRLNKAVALLQ